MPLAFQKLDITLGTLAEGESSKTTIPGTLEVCENATFPKGGRIDKRRGYLLLAMGSTATGEVIAPARLVVNLGQAHGEGLVFGYDILYAVVDRGSNLGDGGLEQRGPTLRGAAEVLHVATAQLSVPE